MQQVGELGDRRVSARVGEERPGLEDRDLGVVLHRRQVQRVERPDLLGRPLLGRGAREHLAQHDRHPRVVPLQRGEDQLQVAGDDLGRRPFLEVVRADEQHDRRRVEREHVLLEPQEDAAGRVAADAAVRHLHAGERRAEPSPQPCVIESPEEDDRAVDPGRRSWPTRSGARARAAGTSRSVGSGRRRAGRRRRRGSRTGPGRGPRSTARRARWTRRETAGSQRRRRAEDSARWGGAWSPMLHGSPRRVSRI